MEKTVTLKHLGFRCTGTAVINLWGGGQGTIDMDWWDCNTDDRKEIVKGINDGQFGCESIESAIVHISDHYENGYTEYKEMIDFSAKELKEVKRGI